MLCEQLRLSDFIYLQSIYNKIVLCKTIIPHVLINVIDFFGICLCYKVCSYHFRKQKRTRQAKG